MQFHFTLCMSSYLCLFCSMLDENWPVYSSHGPAYGEIRGPSDFIYVNDGGVREHYCALWLY